MRNKPTTFMVFVLLLLCCILLTGCHADENEQPVFSDPERNIIQFKSSESLKNFFIAAEQSDQELLQFLENTPYEEFSDDGIFLYSFEQGNRAPVETFLSYMETLPFVTPTQDSTQVMGAFKYYVDSKPFPWFDLTYKNDKDATRISYRFIYKIADEDIRHMTNDEYQASLKRNEQFIWADLDGIKFKLYQSDDSEGYAYNGFFLLDEYYVMISISESTLPTNTKELDCWYLDDFDLVRLKSNKN
jgi:hypothetical protein